MSAPTVGNDGGQVVEVDFTEHRDPLALADDIQTQVDEIRLSLEKAVNRDKQFRRWREAAYRRALRYLRRQLAEERALTAPHDDDVLGALAGFDRPASATEIAERVYRRRPPHSAIVRIGLTLVRLAETGRVTRVPVKAHGKNRNRWEVVADA